TLSYPPLPNAPLTTDHAPLSLHDALPIFPGSGDDTRAYPPFREKNRNGERESLYFANINRNKKGVTLNLKTDAGKELFKRLVERSEEHTLNSSHVSISYAVFCLKKKNN